MLLWFSVLVFWLNHPQLRSVAEELLKKQFSLSIAPQMDLWNVAQITREDMKRASASARRILRTTSYLSREVRAAITLAENFARPAIRQRAKFILSGHPYPICSLAF